jgi:ubiquinone/menaquinone biosynthesis C-methylase UbiE
MTNGVVRTFDEVAPVYDSVLPFFATAARGFLHMIEPMPGARLLDLGCGTGALTAEALARGCEVTAVDAAPSMIERLRTSLPTVDARVMDATALALADDSFDIVVAAFVLHLLDHPTAAAREASRVLRPGGLFAFVVPGPHVDEAIPLDQPGCGLDGSSALSRSPTSAAGARMRHASVTSSFRRSTLTCASHSMTSGIPS